MYMGYFDAGKPKRISRADRARVLSKVPGPHAWLFRRPGMVKLVIQADTPPAAEVIECANEECRAQNVKGADVCTVCGSVLIGKNCIVCGTLLPASALNCAECGSSQIPEIVLPWRCNVCEKVNGHDVNICGQCNATRSSLNSASFEFLKLNSERDDKLCGRAFDRARGRISIAAN